MGINIGDKMDPEDGIKVLIHSYNLGRTKEYEWAVSISEEQAI
jgi:hypothetical protein